MMKVAVPKETYPGEHRVSLVPANIPQLAKLGLDVVVESGAGESAGYPDDAYRERGAEVVAERGQVFAAEIVVQVRCLGMNAQQGAADLEHLRGDQIVMGMCDPLGEPAAVQQVADTGATLFALELIPRITRAQSMDILSSMATVAGYRAVLIASVELPKMFPLLMTAAGTVTAARVFVIGGGVAGLQAIATARRLGAVVHAYDVRPAVREQVESLGGKFVELELEAGQSEDKGGYARQMGEEFYQKQRDLMASVVAESDVVVTTAAIPGKPSPRLITASAVQGMRPGSVIVDLAAERGGNCELSRADERVVEHGVVILGPTNLPSEVPFHASQMFSNNVVNFLKNLVEDGQPRLDSDDQIICETMVSRGKEVVSARIRDLLGLAPRKVPAVSDAETENPPEVDQDSSSPPSADSGDNAEEGS
jgi:NAD(P) transhydrogenase subunit alpha